MSKKSLTLWMGERKKLFFLRECRRANLSPEVGITCYVTKIRPLLELQSGMVFHNTSKTNLKEFKREVSKS